MGSDYFNKDYSKPVGLNSIVYVVTDDGFIYETDFSGINPWGFMFFANNRGIVSIETNYPKYMSYVGKGPKDQGYTADQLADLVNQDATFHNPTNPNTALDGEIAVAAFDELIADTTYYLKETVAPVGYICPNNSIAINVNKSGLATVTPSGGESYNVEAAEDNVVSITVANFLGVTIPSTGPGLFTAPMLTGIGFSICVMAMIGICFLTKKQQLEV